MRPLKLATWFAIVLTVGGSAHALINPRFTPIHLVKQSTLIALVKPSAPDAKGLLTARVLKSLKGKAPADKVTIALLPDWIKPLAADAAAAGDGPGLLFACKGEDQQETALLHLAGHWLRLEAKGAADFAMKADDVEMRGTWAGGSDMLAKAVEYILSAADPVVPVAVGCTWSERKVLGKIDGPVNAAQAVTAGDRVWIGTAEGAVKLLKQIGASVVAACFVIDLPDLGGAKKIRDLGVPVRTLVAFGGH